MTRDRLTNLAKHAATTLAVLSVGVVAALVTIEQGYGVGLAPDNFRFERPAAASLLLGALLVFIAQGPLRQLRSPRMLVSRGLDLGQLPATWRTRLSHLPTALRCAALALFTFGLMGPQSILARDSTEVRGIDIVLTMDVSLSMQAADIKPNRFEATQHVVDEFVQKRPNDRIGAVIFGLDAYTLSPLTTDHEALRSMIASLELGAIEGRGTAVGNAIGTALNRLRKSDAKSRAMILLTDGESNSGNVSPKQAAEYAKSLGVKIYTVLMGRSEDAPVQMGVDLFGRPLLDRGNFPINPKLLKEVAELTGGKAFQVSDREGLERSFHSILDQLQKSDIEDTGRVYGELFPAFVVPGLVLLLLEAMLSLLWLRRWP